MAIIRNNSLSTSSASKSRSLAVAPKQRLAVDPKTPVQRKALTTRAHRVCEFIERYVVVPQDKLVGQQMKLLPEQKEFVSGVYNNVDNDGRLITRRGILSMPRKSGKSALTAALLEAHLIGPEANQNAQLYSAARSRDQAALIFNYAAKSIRLNPKLEGLVQITDSTKKIVGLAKNTTYKALSADATTAHGLSPALTIHDELGQVIGPTDKLYDALETAGGAQEEPLSLIISTQAASDTDLLSTLIDDAILNCPPDVVCRLYAAKPHEDIFDEKIWYRVNFALGKFRDLKEFRQMAEQAKRMPTTEATFRNLYLNMRISLQSLVVPPTLWKENDAKPNDYLFKTLPVHIALDLSQRTDLTAVVLAVQDPDTALVHLKCYVFTPMEGLRERSIVDRQPYEMWVRQAHLIQTPGRIVDYAQVVEFMAAETHDMNIASVNFDRWRIDLLRKEAENYGFATEEHIPWVAVGQGFKDMSPCIESLETVLLNRLLAHGSNPLLNMAVGQAVELKDPAGNRKMNKAKSSGRIDPLVAATMAIHACLHPPGEEDKEIEHNVDDFLIA